MLFADHYYNNILRLIQNKFQGVPDTEKYSYILY